ncbi:MAG: HYR domain-containing protein [Verrucomicrobiota bacterium]
MKRLSNLFYSLLAVWFVAGSAFAVDTTPPVLTVPADLTVEATSASGAVVNYTTPTATDDVGVTSVVVSGASFNDPWGVSVDGSGNVYVADFTNNKIRKITSNGVVSTLAGSGSSGSVDGPGTGARFNGPSDVCVDGNGNVYVADTGNKKIRKITSAGVVSTLAGSGSSGSADGIGTAASFAYPEGVCVDGSGNVYVADTGNNKIRKITSDGVVSTLAGSGVSGSADGTGAGASFDNPKGVCVDGSGNVYVADFYNQKIRKITSDGLVSTLAGSGSYGRADGTGTAASFAYPQGVCVDGSANVYVADTSYHTIRKITSNGVVTTLAGSGTSGSADGTGSGASFYNPLRVCVDGSGNVYVADRSNNVIRKITSSGVVSTIAGSGKSGSDDGAGFSSGATFPLGTQTLRATAIDAAGNSVVKAFNVSVVDTTPPVFTAMPGNITVKQTSEAGTPVTFSPATASDAVSNATSNNTITYTKASGSLFPIGATTVTVTARDSAYNYATGTFTVTVTPIITVPADVIVAATSANGAVVNYTTPTAASEFAATSLVASAVKFDAAVGVSVDADGNLYVTDNANHRLRKITSGGVVSTLAGSGLSGAVDGPGASASFYYLSQVCVDGSGNVYVTDNSLDKIRKITSEGVVSTFAGSGSSGSVDGTGTAASFNSPHGVCVDGSGNVYVADIYSNKIRKITSAGVVSTLAGSGVAGKADGTGTAASFSDPWNLCVDGAGNVYVTSRGSTDIRKITSDGVVSTISGLGTPRYWHSVFPISVDGSGNVYVADNDNYRIRKITSGGVVSTFAGSGVSGDRDGTGTGAIFEYIQAMCVDGSGNVYVVDNERIRKITSGGVVSTFVGSGVSGYSDASGLSGSTFPVGTTAVYVRGTNAAGEFFTNTFNVTVVDTTPPVIAVPSNITAQATSSSGAVVNYTTPTATDDVGVTSLRNVIPSFYYPYGVCVDGSGNVYVADSNNHKIRKITSSGMVSTLAGSGSSGSADGTGAGASFKYPQGVCVDGSGNVYVADTRNYKIRKITSAGVVTTLAGSGSYGSADGTGTAASFDSPQGVCVDGSGNVYVADSSNHKIRKITSDGVVSTLAGSGSSGSADGIGVAASFKYPYGVCVDGSGNVYVGDSSNNKIRKITSSGVVSTLAGSGSPGSADGSGTAASFNNPYGVCVDGSGTLYVADSSNNKIRKITSAGVVSTLAGSGSYASADGSGTAASFYSPHGVCVDGSGNVYVGDYYNHKIRKITSAGVVTTLAGSGSSGSDDGVPTGGVQTASGSVFPVGTTIVSYSARDAAGNSSVATFTVTVTPVNDTTPPVLKLPANVTAFPGGLPTSAIGAIVTYSSATATDNLTASPTITYSKASGSVFPVGVTTVTVTATDDAKNKATGTFTVTVGTPGPVPKITTQPVGGTVLVGGSIKLTVAATSTTPMTYLWMKDGTSLSGGTAASYTLIPTSTLASGSYSCFVSNTSGGAESKSAIVVASLPSLPVVKTQPVGGTLQPKGTIKLSVTATSPVPLSYQWRKNGSVISGATNPNYTVAEASAEPAGKYDCLVKNTAGEVTTSVASVLLPQTLAFAQPAPVTYGCEPILLGGSASSGSPLTYKVVSGPATVSGSTLTITGAGSVVLKVSQTGDATHVAAADVSKTLVVAKKTLTVSAGSKTRLVGAANPTFALTYSGFVNGDTEAVLDKKPTATTTATTSSAEGSYPVTISGGSDNNYTLVYSTGATLLVTGFGGAYEALLLDPDHAPIGKLELLVPLNSLAYSGKLTLTNEAKSVTLVGVLQANSEGTAAESTLTLTRKDLPTLTLKVSVSGDSLMATLGRVGLSELTSGTTGSRLYTVPAKASAPWAGTYTMVFREPTSNDSKQRDYPHGANYASVVIAPATGFLTFTGYLADKTGIAGVLKPDAKGRYRLLIYGSRLSTYLSGQLSLMAHPDTERFPNSFYIPSSSEESFLVWANTGGPKDNSYRPGFGPLEYGVSLDPWHAPVTGNKTAVARTLAQQLGLVSGSTESATISVDYSPDSIDLGTLGASLPRKVSLAPGATVSVVESVTPPVNATKWKVSITPATGLFEGSFTLVDVVTSLATRHTRDVKFSGILRQAPEGETSVGNGFFLLPALPTAATPEQPSLEIQLSAPAK